MYNLFYLCIIKIILPCCLSTKKPSFSQKIISVSTIPQYLQDASFVQNSPDPDLDASTNLQVRSRSPSPEKKDPFSVALEIGEDVELCTRAVEEIIERKKQRERMRKEGRGETVPTNQTGSPGQKGPVTLANDQCARGLTAFKKLDPFLQRRCPEARNARCCGVGGRGRRYSKCMVEKLVTMPWLKWSWYWKVEFKDCIKPLQNRRREQLHSPPRT